MENENRYSKSYYKIKEASDLLNIPPSTLRYWEQEFPDLKPRRSSTNQRYYSPSDMEKLEIICFLLYTKGLKIEAAKEYLKHNKTNVAKKLQLLNKLESVRDDLEVLLKSLNLRNQHI